MRYSLPCKVDGQGAWDAKLGLTDSASYVAKKVLENMGFMHVSLSDYGRKIVNDVNMEIHGVKFKAGFVVLDYVNEGEPSILFGREFLSTTKSQVDFGLGEIRMNLTKFKKGIDVIDLFEEVGRSSEEARRNSTNFHYSTQPIYHPLTSKQKEKMKEVLDIKYKDLEESKPILEVLENYVIYKKKLDEILIGKERLNKKEFSEEDKVGIIEHGLPKKICDPGNYVLPIKINGVVEMVALVDTGASVPKSKTLCLIDNSSAIFESMPLRTATCSMFIDIEGDMERELAMDAYFNPFKMAMKDMGHTRKLMAMEIGMLGLKLLRLVEGSLIEYLRPRPLHGSYWESSKSRMF
ncbi:hypothetical protein Tco_0862904 [Tanacetum coccineum]